MIPAPTVTNSAESKGKENKITTQRWKELPRPKMQFSMRQLRYMQTHIPSAVKHMSKSTLSLSITGLISPFCPPLLLNTPEQNQSQVESQVGAWYWQEGKRLSLG